MTRNIIKRFVPFRIVSVVVFVEVYFDVRLLLLLLNLFFFLNNIKKIVFYNLLFFFRFLFESDGLNAHGSKNNIYMCVYIRDETKKEANSYTINQGEGNEYKVSYIYFDTRYLSGSQ